MPVKVSKITPRDLDKTIREQLKDNVYVIDQFLSKVATKLRYEAKRSTEFEDLTGNLRLSIKKRKSKYEDGGYIVIASGRHGGGKTDKGYHAHLVEFGHAKVLWGVPKPGERVEPRKFMRRARALALREAGNILEKFK